MDYTSIILAAATKMKVSGTLLLAICSWESGLNNLMVEHDGKEGTPSYGICMVKYETAQMVGYTGDADGLMNPKTNAKYAAKYLAYQVSIYGEEDWCKLVASYNAGSFKQSRRVPGKPVNLPYVRHVQSKLETSLQYKLSCDNNKITIQKESTYEPKVNEIKKRHLKPASRRTTGQTWRSEQPEDNCLSYSRLFIKCRLRDPEKEPSEEV